MLVILPVLIKLLPMLIGFVETIIETAHDNKLIAAGQAEAIAAALSAAQAQVALARQAEADAEARHGTDASDAAFDRDFQRKD
ncbi:MAG: hypothetical protein NVSMB26_28020 [Beijerinckiaceae bacterium]